MLIIKNKYDVADTMKFVARNLKYTTRIMKHNADDTKAMANIILCEHLLREIIEENTDRVERAAIECAYFR